MPRNTVVTRELLVQKSVIGRQQIENATILLQLTLKEQLEFPNEGGTQIVVEPWKLSVRVRCQQPHVTRLKPLAEKIGHKRAARPRLGEHTPGLLLEHLRIMSFP